MKPGTRVRLHGSPFKGEHGTIADTTQTGPFQHWPIWVHPDRDPARYVGFREHEVSEET